MSLLLIACTVQVDLTLMILNMFQCWFSTYEACTKCFHCTRLWAVEW